MRILAMVGAALLGFCLLTAGVATAAQPDRTAEPTRVHAAPTDVSAQARKRRRAPTRITVSPARQLVRECADWYALERRPSGDVITPQMRCWWAYR